MTNTVESTECPNSLSIKNLIARSNLLTNLNCIRKMVNLTLLDLSSNKLTQVSESDFADLTKLISLDLSFNNLKDLDLQALFPTKLNNLKVDQLLNYDNLHEKLPKLTQLSLSTKKWDCAYVNSIGYILSKHRIRLSLNSELKTKEGFACQSTNYAIAKAPRTFY